MASSILLHHCHCLASLAAAWNITLFRASTTVLNVQKDLRVKGQVTKPAILEFPSFPNSLQSNIRDKAVQLERNIGF